MKVWEKNRDSQKVTEDKTTTQNTTKTDTKTIPLVKTGIGTNDKIPDDANDMSDEYPSVTLMKRMGSFSVG